jgi:AI-2 transport protein TqsA
MSPITAGRLSDQQHLSSDGVSNAVAAGDILLATDRPKLNLLVFASAAGLIVLVAYLMVVGAPILLPFVIAVFVWYLINALATLSARVRIGGRVLPGSVRLGLGIGVLLVTSWLMVHLVIGNVGHVMAAGPVYEQNLLRLANRGGGWLGLEEFNDLRLLLGGLNLNGFIRSLTLGLTGMIGSAGTVAIYTVFLLLEQHHFDTKIAALFPDPQREALVRRILQRIGSEIQSYIWLKTVISAATALACYAVMKAVGLNLAEFWALLIFALNYIPYIGSWLGVIFPSFLALVQFDSLTPILMTILGLTLIQFTGGSIIEPRLMGTGLNISPVFMLLSLAMWGAMWGVIGMLLAVPIMVVVMIVCSHFTSTRPIAVLISADGELRS